MARCKKALEAKPWGTTEQESSSWNSVDCKVDTQTVGTVESDWDEREG